MTADKDGTGPIGWRTPTLSLIGVVPERGS